jgi:hypothetical protein
LELEIAIKAEEEQIAVRKAQAQQVETSASIKENGDASGDGYVQHTEWYAASSGFLQIYLLFALYALLLLLLATFVIPMQGSQSFLKKISILTCSQSYLGCAGLRRRWR